jgi:hypothetical protein
MKVICENCGTPFEGHRKTARFCSGVCRVTFSRKKKPEPVAEIREPPAELTGIDLAIWKAEQKAKS